MTRPIRIFLAEDNPGDVELVHEALREHGISYTLSLASDGREAKHFIERMGTASDAPCPDVLLLDLNLPKTDGHELLALFRSHPQCAGVPVVIVTSSNARKDRERAAALGAARYFRKPLELSEFLELGAVIRELVEERGRLLGA